MKVDKECSISKTEWFFLEMYYHPENKMDLPILKRGMTLAEVLDYKESLDVMSLLKNASDIDEKRSQSK